MNNPAELANRTAIGRKAPAAPFRFCESHLDEGRILHIGEGKDIYTTRKLIANPNLDVHVHDPLFGKVCEHENHYFDYALCFYVLCVLPPTERTELMQQIGRFLKPDGTLFIAVRTDHKNIKGTPFEDGVVTSRGTFQKPYTKTELEEDMSLYFRLVTFLKTNSSNYLLVKCRDYYDQEEN